MGVFPQHFLPRSTERLILRRFVEQDLERFLAYRHDPQVAKFQSWSALSPSQAQRFIEEMSTAELGIPGDWFQIAIAHKSTNVLIGDMGLQVYRDDPPTAEIGFTLSRGNQGNGYAHEAAGALIQALFGLGIIHKVIAITDSRNRPCIQLLERLGMRFVGSEEVEFRGEPYTENMFELTQ